MTTTNIEIYNALVAAGVEKTKAEAVAAEILTKTEAKDTLATKKDLADLKSSLMQWFTVILISALLAQAALIVALIQLLQ